MKKTYNRPEARVIHVEICKVVAQSTLSISSNYANDSEAEVQEETFQTNNIWDDQW